MGAVVFFPVLLADIRLVLELDVALTFFLETYFNFTAALAAFVLGIV